jgi:uncharacterized protein YqjF (DUF2071 family)
MAMRWHEVLFAHWPMRPEVLRPLVPPSLELDTFDGWAWIGVVPFHMSGVRLRYVPERGCSLAFPELNVRTYVKSPGRSGVWFFSLDAVSRLAVRLARLWYGLPYYEARMEVRSDGEHIHYRSARTHRGAAPAQFEATYRPLGAVYQATPGTLEHWLTARYGLYVVDRRGRPGYGAIHHPPWPLQGAAAEIRRNTMTHPLGLALPPQQPMLHFARRLDVVAWSVQRLDP